MNCRPPQGQNFQAKLTENGKGKNIGTPRKTCFSYFHDIFIKWSTDYDKKYKLSTSNARRLILRKFAFEKIKRKKYWHTYKNMNLRFS